ncbi:hypothetical protein P7K49_009722 [Saguinus oedipus]|uniref:Uncharacterized protein n=1 Tax=Saguinus oedipus TaxID=9490 RepID=A0ABQ9VKS0_SAGOE|nr:hypothetical protein P7K49_009722 [Saguinus oedipus]
MIFPGTPIGLLRPVLCISSLTKGETEAPREVGRAGRTSGPAPGAVFRLLRRGGPLGIRVSSGKRLAANRMRTSDPLVRAAALPGGLVPLEKRLSNAVPGALHAG